MDDVCATAETLESILTDAARVLSCVDTPASDAALPGVGTVLAERYLLERLLGQGAMGLVFAARHVVTGRRVAIKVLREDPVRNRNAALRMAREARAVGRIHHPNVVAVYDAGFAQDRPFIAMELLDGESLEQRMQRTGPMSEPEATSTLQQIAQGVAAAHANGIIHRDLKPANILLCAVPGVARQLVKVVDFGISKLHGDAEEDVLVTSHGAQLGTPAFMSPEQVRGDTLDERSDVYALAVILYYALTQHFPFQARSRAELFAKILTEQPEPLAVHRPGVSQAVASVVLKGLARERARRYESVAAFAEALSHASSRPRPPRSRSAAITSRIVYLTAAVSGIALATMPARLMHAAPPLAEAAAIEAQPAAEPAPSMTAAIADRSVPETQPTAAEAQALTQPPRALEPAPARPKARGPRPSLERAAPNAREDTAADQVKLMSW